MLFTETVIACYEIRTKPIKTLWEQNAHVVRAVITGPYRDNIKYTDVYSNLFLNNQPDALIIQIYSVIKLYMFGHLLCPSSGVFYCTFGTGKFHAGF